MIPKSSEAWLHWTCEASRTRVRPICRMRRRWSPLRGTAGRDPVRDRGSASDDGNDDRPAAASDLHDDDNDDDHDDHDDSDHSDRPPPDDDPRGRHRRR